MSWIFGKTNAYIIFLSQTIKELTMELKFFTHASQAFFLKVIKFFLCHSNAL